MNIINKGGQTVTVPYSYRYRYRTVLPTYLTGNMCGTKQKVHFIVSFHSIPWFLYALTHSRSI